ncbi:TetR/AcrR family transcriptional regulator [Citricoccus alkalitolerans]|uniref:TetR/AcrR family transcriptional regulator n=1 Tax=Citricoccus alkalitolerans TaxID=246603 RepID=A0ABV8XT05_9MICC
MTPTESTATRDKVRTRKAILEAAVLLMTEQGAGVSLADIASQAGVSKGALTHHFTSRSALEEGILSDTAQRFWSDVHAHVDLSENRPGKLLRAYIRALTTDSDTTREVFSPSSILTVIGNNATVQQFLVHDAETWRGAFGADGIEPGLSLVLRHAAEGLASCIDTPYLSAEELDVARARLLLMAEADEGDQGTSSRLPPHEASR